MACAGSPTSPPDNPIISHSPSDGRETPLSPVETEYFDLTLKDKPRRRPASRPPSPQKTQYFSLTALATVRRSNSNPSCNTPGSPTRESPAPCAPARSPLPYESARSCNSHLEPSYRGDSPLEFRR